MSSVSESKFVIEPSQNINMELLKTPKISLAELVLAIRDGLTLAGSIDGKNIAVCISVDRGDRYEIVYFAVDSDYWHLGYGKEILFHMLDYIKLLGGVHVEAGAGNADVPSFAFLQRAGFRVIGVEHDYYKLVDGSPVMENSIANRDRIRYYADLEALYREQ